MPLSQTYHWGPIQKRTVDPGSEYSSQQINKIFDVLGKNNSIMRGMEAEKIIDESTNILFIKLSPGIVIKDNVAIQFTKDSYLKLGLLDETMQLGMKYIVVDYMYELKFPPNIATIKIIDTTEFNPEQHLILYRLFINQAIEDDVVIETYIPSSSMESLSMDIQNMINQQVNGAYLLSLFSL